MLGIHVSLQMFFGNQVLASHPHPPEPSLLAWLQKEKGEKKADMWRIIYGRKRCQNWSLKRLLIFRHTRTHGQELEAVESIPPIGHSGEVVYPSTVVNYYHGGELAPLLSPAIPTKSLSAWIHMSTIQSTSKLVKTSNFTKLLHEIVHETSLQDTLVQNPPGSRYILELQPYLK